MHMQFVDILRKSVEALGMPTEGINTETTAVELTFDGLPAVSIEFEPETEHLIISSLFCHYPDRERLGNVLEFLMNAHAYGQYTHGAFFSANSERCQIIFHQVLQSEYMTADRLSLNLVRFLEALKYWKELMDSGELLVVTSAIPKPQSPILRAGEIKA